MPKSSRLDLEANLGRHGSIDTDFTVMTHSVMTHAGSRHGEGIHGTVNGGGTALRIESERGEIRLLAR
jgi:hypothetical protein